MDLIEYFYFNIICRPIESDEDYIKSKCTLEYLEDCNFNEKEIINLFSKWDKKVIRINPEDIPLIAWDNSLLKKNTFYLHKELKLFPSPSIVTPDGKENNHPYYMEIKIKYTIEDLLKYFYFYCGMPHSKMDEKLHTSQVKHLLERFKSYKDIQPIDLFLTLVDECNFQNFRCIQPFDLTSVASIVQNNYEKLKSNLAELHSQNKDKIIWRTQFRTSDMNLVRKLEMASTEIIL